MFDPANEPEFRLDVAGLSDTFEVLAFTGREAISEPFVFDMELLIEDPTLDLASLLYRSASLHFGPQGNSVHGQLQELVQRDHGSTLRLCHVRLGPRLGCLAQRFSQRIFSGRSVPQILDQVLREHGIVGHNRRFELDGDYPLRDYCTQYRESDLQFVQRLCAQERLHYHFEHRARGHCVVFADGQGHFRKGAEVDFRVEGNQPAVRRFEVQRCADSTLLSAQGHSDLTRLRSGQLMPLSGHPVRQWNHLWLLTHLEHQGSQDAQVPYCNHVRAMHWEATFESPRCEVKPQMHSLQRAWVVDVDEPRPDPSRPVAVQFDWVYQGEGAAPSHCWLPMAPELEAAGVGPLSEGAEVVVSFIEGDPDQPLITGVIQLPACVEEEQATAATITGDRPPAGVQGWLRSGEPLLLLCLLPGGGSFNHCAQALCTCRALTQPGRSGVA
ncbi:MULTISPECIES: contractile injection system protein, VgrG/Pvc8 family [Pseudomonas]|jgi:type VI secretion system secreted protein VgrG|uniref:Actin cross-linking toxin VgrG1 n=1 Tax=Pseudomonas fluorescens TaxID=294 RepID=A0A5E7DWI0_PSEFL|nr:contractile injection system protein, VgrG/Pvc8 family [Pseudomonas fluorescens]VVO20826.1 Actin cross-linking toxin VgrG1 [Pseudomonas fluorescens]